MAARLLADKTVMVLGGAGLVGTAIARRLALLKPHLRPQRLIVAALTQLEAQNSVNRLRQEQQERQKNIPHWQNAAKVEFVPAWGNIFVRSDLAHLPRTQLLASPERRQALLTDRYDNVDEAYEQNYLVRLLRTHRPQVLIDSINTATGLSYQNVFDAASKVRQALHPTQGNDPSMPPKGDLVKDSERMLLAQSVPALVRHVQILSKVSQEVGIENYLKVGTTGTGGMGLNLPFTHSESKPSNLLLAKSEAAFGHSGLLYLWSQTPGAPKVRMQSVFRHETSSFVGQPCACLRYLFTHVACTFQRITRTAVPKIGARGQARCRNWFS